MKCPRCGSENADSRSACWSCLAQLHPSEDGKVRQVSVTAVPIPSPEQVSPPAPIAEEPAFVEDIIAPELPVAEPEPAFVEEVPLPEPVAPESVAEEQPPAGISVFGTDTFGVAAESEPEPPSPAPVIDIHEVGTSSDDEAVLPDTDSGEEELASGRVLDLDSQNDQPVGVVPGLAYAPPEETADEPAAAEEESPRAVFDLDSDEQQSDESSEEKNDH